MGRNAKLYKSHKAKKKQSSIQSSVSDPVHGRAITSKRGQVREERSGGRAAAGESEEEVGGEEEIGSAKKAANESLGSIGSSGKLKSKLWKNLEAKRAKEGKRHFTTPKEAGIDYLRQWEKRGR